MLLMQWTPEKVTAVALGITSEAMAELAIVILHTSLVANWSLGPFLLNA